MRCCVRSQENAERCRRLRDRRGFTLLEVVVGTVLLASLVSGVVLATGAHQRKLLFARQKAIAIQAADELLSGWDQSRSGIPPRAVGVLADGAMQWQTQVLQSRLVCQIPVHVVRLTIHRNSGDGGAIQLCLVDVIVDAAGSVRRRRP